MSTEAYNKAVAKLSAHNVEMIGVTKVNKASFVVSTVEARRLFDTKWTEVCDYNKFRKVIIDLCKQKGACEEEFRKLVSATDMASFNDVLKANFHWCCNNEVLTGDIIDTYGLAEYGIRHNVDASGGYLLACGSATVEASGSATVLAWGSAYIHAPYGAIECKLSGQAILRHNGVIKSATSEMKLP